MKTGYSEIVIMYWKFCTIQKSFSHLPHRNGDDKGVSV